MYRFLLNIQYLKCYNKILSCLWIVLFIFIDKVILIGAPEGYKCTIASKCNDVVHFLKSIVIMYLAAGANLTLRWGFHSEKTYFQVWKKLNQHTAVHVPPHHLLQSKYL